jgi:hypothetical protein
MDSFSPSCRGVERALSLSPLARSETVAAVSHLDGDGFRQVSRLALNEVFLDRNWTHRVLDKLEPKPYEMPEGYPGASR